MDIEGGSPLRQKDPRGEDRETPDDPDDRTSRIVRKNYLSMVALAYAMACASAWSSSYACGEPLHSAQSAGADATDAMGASDAEDGASPSTRQDGPSSCAADRGRPIAALVGLTLAAALLVASFLDLQGSDPGFLAGDPMDRWDRAVEEEESGRSQRQHGADTERRSFLDSSTDGNGGPESPEPDSDITHDRPPRLYPHARRKRCEACVISPPLRSHHCRVNGRCVATFDHHCGFLNTCIGERNHFRFWLFVSLNLVCSHDALGILSSGYKIQDGVWLAVGLMSRLYVGFIWLAAALMWVIHTVIAVSNVTTFEMTRGSDIDYLRGTRMFDCPFGGGPCRNVMAFFARDDMSKSIRRARGRRVEDWTPVMWRMPRSIERDSSDVWNNPYQNKYWSCC